ncbi:MAG TPA: class I SAM-dependent methyltransferase [Solirubrobacterales bacterium]
MQCSPSPGDDRPASREGQASLFLTVDDGASEAAVRYDAWFTTPIGQAMDAAEARAVLGLAGVRRGERALDAGCGTGIYTRRLVEQGAEVTGVDIDPEMLAAARVKVPSATLVEADVTHLPFADGSFDLSLAVTLLCFVEDAELAAAELVRVTRPGGRVVLAELNPWSLWAAWRQVKAWRGSETWREARYYSPRALARLLGRAGAERVRIDAAAYLPPGSPAWLRSRAASCERRARHLGSLGAAFSLARGEVD